MRFATNVMAALLVTPVVLTQTPANALPCDNTRWCAQYWGWLAVVQTAAFLLLSSAGQP